MSRAALSRLGRTCLVAALTTVLAAPSVSGQSELVIYKEGKEQYHRPGCDVIKSGRGVVALTRAQAEARGYKPHPACDRDRQNTAASDDRGAPAVVPTVYVNGTKYYHRKDCRRLDADPKAVHAESLDTAGKNYWPCPDCRPPVRKRSAAPAVGRGR